MDREEYKRAALESWQAMAAGWERRREYVERVMRPVTEWMVWALEPQPGELVLELAAGAGETGFAAAALLGDDGRLVSSDFSSEMVEVARRRSTELGLANVEHRVIDAEEISLEDDAVNGVLCRFGLMLMPDPAKALAETRRVLRAGGRLALAVWSTADRNPWVSITGRILAERGLVPRPKPGEPGMFVLADEARLRGLLESAGFGIARIEDVPVLFEFEDVEDYIAGSRETGGLFSRAWREASDEDREAIRDGLLAGFEPFRSDGGYALPGVALCVAAG